MPSDQIRITVLGSGTSVGVPTPGCDCPVCRSTDPRDHRLRPSVLIQFDDRTVIVDTTPDLRTQVLRHRIQRLDAVLFTHEHADHIMGLDDVRPFNFRQKGPIPVFGSADTLDRIRSTFSYIFSNRKSESSIPKLELKSINAGEPFDLFGLEFMPILLEHGQGKVFGYRFGGAAYLTDHSDIPEPSLALLNSLDVLFLDALRHKPHPTHSTIARSLLSVERLRPTRTWFTHLSHDLPHGQTERQLPPHIRLAYDGLQILARRTP